MRSKKLIKAAKEAVTVTLALAMTAGMIPTQNLQSVKAADNSPYNVAKGRMVYASSSVDNSDPAYAVDGSTGTRWESAWGNNDEWMYVDLGKSTKISGIKLAWEGAYAKSYKIQFSDDEEHWSDKYTNNSCNGGNEELNVSGTARYVRIYMTEKALPTYGYSLYEFEVDGVDGVTPRPVDYGKNIAEGKTATASSLRDVWWLYDDNGVLDQTTVKAQNAVDGDENSYWTSGEKDNQWLSVDLGREYEIGRVIINWSSDAGKIYDIQTSTDGTNWTTLYRQTKGSGNEVANVELYGRARYVRMYGYTRVESGSGFSIKEMQVYEYKSGDQKVTNEIKELPKSYVVNNNKGSYLTNDIYEAKAKLPVYATDNIKMPIASNDWWQSSLINKFGNTMSTLPLKAKYSTKGLGILTATDGWLPTMGATDVNVSVISETKTDFYILPENLDNATACDKVMDYSDYSVTLGLFDDNHMAMKSTHVKGSPYIYTEYGDTTAIFISSTADMQYFDGNGNAILTNNLDKVTTDHIGLQVTDDDNKAGTKTSTSYYCLCVPQNTTFKRVGSYIKVTFPTKDSYMSVGTMQSKNQIGKFYEHGYAFVTDTKVTYDYDDNNAVIASHYTLTTKSKRGDFNNVSMQCMLPHQWKNSTDDKNAFTTYKSVRGDLKTVASNTFSTNKTFAGLLPTFATPTSDKFDSEKLLGYLNQLDTATQNLNPAADAYWEGKNLHPLGMGVLMADQMGETELRDTFLARIKKILVNWFTYDGEGDVSYFIYDNNWGTLYYAQSEFGANASICDHHFTYGYFMFAATVLATYDDEFYTEYKDMIELLIRDYANPSDNDNEFCKFRAYDMYEGHSWAGGYADNDSGNNQESASESLFSWVSLYLWGVLTENNTYRDAGVFGFTNEMDAVEQYWFDYDGDNWVKDWPYEVVGQVYGGINFYGTFFGGQPLYVYGIQWLPVSEYLTYYGMNQERCAEIYNGLLKDTETAMDKAVVVARNEGKTEEEIQKMLKDYPQADTGWQHITWPFLSQTNPDLALSNFTSNDTKVQGTDTANTYWFINSMSELGYKTTDVVATGDISAAVYYNKKTNKYTATAWNPTKETKVVTFKTAAGTVGTATIGAKALVSFEVYKDKNFNIVQAQTPEISVPTGTYDDTQYVEIKTATKGAEIHYTTDGTMPTKSSPVYNGVFAVSSTATVKAIAVKDECITSAMASSTITVNGTNVSKDTNIALGKNVVVSSAENPSVGGDKIVDNDESTRWSSEFSDDQWCYIDLGKNYTVNKVTLNWEASYAKSYKIQVSNDGNNWNTVCENANGKGGKETVIFDATSCRYVKMQGVKRALDYGYSLWEMGVYEAATVADPQFSLPSGSYSGNQSVKISSATKGVEIRYTTDGSTPNANSKLYVPSINVNKDMTIKAIAYRKGMIASNVVTATYKVSGGTTEPTEPEQQTTPDDKNVTTIPGTVKVDSYNAKSDEIIFSTENGIKYAGNLVNGSYLEYSVKVPEKGDYTFTLKLAAGDSRYNAKNMTVKVDNKTVATTAIQASSSWTTFVDHKVKVNFAKAGTYKIRLTAEGGACNVTDFTAAKDKETEVVGSTLVSKNKTVTVSGNENDTMTGKNVVDGDEGTRWSSNYADDAWITVDLGKTYSVNKVVLKWEAAYGESYKIQTSTDGNNWTTAKSLTGMKGDTDTVTFNAVNARYVRMQGVKRALPYGYSLWEMEVYAAGNATEDTTKTYGIVSKGKTATASGSESDAMAAKNAIDGDEGTRWSSNFADDAWITVDLGNTYAVDKVVLKWEGAYGESYKIQTSTDGNNWTTVKSLTGKQGGTDTVTFNAVNARYVRMQGVKRGLPYGYSLWELEVYGR